jgi:23S rRNA-/tRNA-specific pseudouridylate synthase
LIAGLSVLYEDERVIAVDKPSGLAVHGLARTTGDDLVSRLRGERLDLAPVHRLDRATSGVLLLAKGPAAARELGQAFQGGLVQKIYVAAVRGEVEPAPCRSGAGGRSCRCGERRHLASSARSSRAGGRART